MKLTNKQTEIKNLLTNNYRLEKYYDNIDRYWRYDLYKGKVRIRKVNGIIIRGLIKKGIIDENLKLK